MKVFTPVAYEDLYKPARYKVFYGGRDGAKSYNFALALLVLGLQEKKHILCTREVQKSIKRSVHKILSRIISEHPEFSKHYEVMDKEIRGLNGSLFAFEGLRLNEDGIKSYESFDIAWIEEAASVSEKSFETIIPTMRKEGSEIWATFNPRFATDPVYQRFVINTPENALVRRVSYRDNPFTTQVMIEERERLRESDPDAFLHIYDGHLDKRKSGSVYARQIEEARKEGRICSVPYDPASEVFTGWDLGFGDATSIWFLQFVGRELRWIDYYENSGEQLDHYVKIVKDKGYNYSKHYLPHDGGHGNIRGLSVDAQLKGMGLVTKVLDREQSLPPGIELLRQTMKYSVFDKKKCADGLHALENHKFSYNDDRNIFSDKPLHDWTSHAADAARYTAIATGFVKNSVASSKKTSYAIRQRGGRGGGGGTFMGN